MTKTKSLRNENDAAEKTRSGDGQNVKKKRQF
jgi:hypothetical protein